MSYSSLAKYVDFTHKKWSSRTGSISRITIHHCAGVMSSLSSFSSLLSKSSYQASYNYGIDNSGNIGAFVDENNRAWTSSSKANDGIAVTIEVSNSVNKEPWTVSTAAYNALINLCVDVCQRNGISKLTYTGKLSGSNLTMHCWFKSTACPGTYLKGKFSTIASTVNSKLSSSSSSSTTAVTTSSATTVTAYDSANGNYISKDQINSSYLNQYILTIDRKTPNPDYATMLKNRVAGVIIEAGYLYNSAHVTVSPRNPYIDQQCKAASTADMPWGLYWTVRARTVVEAKTELYQLQFLIRKYPPVLGMWLHLSLTASTTINNAIIDTYYQEFEILGLLGKIGFYVTEAELSKITWEDYYEDWYLWVVNHISDTSIINTLLEPAFFKLTS